MRIEHVAIWVKDLEAMREFYETYFEGRAGNKYHNPKKDFHSYFISFPNGPRIELMHRPEQVKSINSEGFEIIGYAHLAFSLGSKTKVDGMTERFRSDGFRIVGEPRTTGDGYYESVVLDPEGNKIELTV